MVDLGYLPHYGSSVIDGIFGPATAQAISKYKSQRDIIRPTVWSVSKP